MTDFFLLTGPAALGAAVLVAAAVIAGGEGVRYAIARYRKRRENTLAPLDVPVANPVHAGDRIAVFVRRVANGYLVSYFDYVSDKEYVWCCQTVEDVCAHTRRRLAEIELSR